MAADGRRRERPDRPCRDPEAERWELLIQVDSDDDLDMMWGDVGTLYWLSRTGDAANDDPTAISFTWQCC
ncbi:DUF1963 domain-containing protein [Phycicoccus sp. DTK01]|uniref:DUF1963 domain-containing protein n=1 Tax=Phycicoccus sp. DTK01 TaxID=2785745 RepID=UPI001A906394|nr:DUF1963 domain-containing protein [Phycicoccus sp. DTK01]GIL34228.1 hypothetical protein PDTK01_03050 [Phycicoccus sp. DTK01]